MTAAFNVQTVFDMAGQCSVCGVEMVMPAYLVLKRREDGKPFYCCNGHEQVYRKSEVERLRGELEAANRRIAAERARAEMAERSAAAHKGKVTEIRNRVGNGVCPCCKRSFQNLRRHMGTKHPEFKEPLP